MGGSAYLIYGKPNESARVRRPKKRNFIDKLLLRQRYSESKTFQVGNSIHWELPSEHLSTLYKDFLSFVEIRLAEPNEASKYIVEYLRSRVMKVFLRGEVDESRRQEDWYVQLSFSGCAGMVETTAELCSHWTDIWLNSERHRVFSDILEPAGFFPLTENIPEQSFPPFCPVGRYGYAIYHAHLESYQDFHFEIDAAYLESGDENQILSEIEDKYLGRMRDNLCRCQLCDPCSKCRTSADC